MMDMRRLAIVIFACLIVPSTGFSQEKTWYHGTSIVEPVKYPEGFAHFDYVNVDAPKGGDLRLSASGTFDTLNPVLEKGELASGLSPRLSLVTETLMKPSLDEIDAEYGLLAEAVHYPDDYSFATYRLRPEARWADGQPVTPEDVVFSFERFKELTPQYAVYYAHVVKAEKTGERDVTFTFDEKNNRELPKIIGQLDILPKHWWEGTGSDGKPRDITRTTLEPVMGSGPYRIADFKPGAYVRYELRDDYWGKDLNVNIGYHNFRTVTYTYYADLDVEFEIFRAGNTDFWLENKAMRWANSYDFPAVANGDVKREMIENDYRSSGVMVGFIPNMRRDKFKNRQVRQALNYAFDFEELNKTLFFEQYKRIDSYFYGSDLASAGLPSGQELQILEQYRDRIPPEIFTAPYKNPVAGDQTKLRENLRQAIALFREGGYEIRNGRMTNTKTGEPFVFEILLGGPTIEPVALSFSEKLRQIGVGVSVRVVDQAQYTNRVRSFDYDVIYLGWAQSLHPGNEQRDYWGSNAATSEGSRNYAGISDPVVDDLIQQIIFAKDRDTLVATTKALDRVLLANAYVVPSYTLRASRLAYRSWLQHPEELPTYSNGFPDIWWAKAQ
ncbi:ABC transporter substrate-binding protein [Ciceribacter sp. L1K22]|nr:ABC transporter substrate-binding protein [Ciceribacter sp. L1K22]